MMIKRDAVMKVADDDEKNLNIKYLNEYRIYVNRSVISFDEKKFRHDLKVSEPLANEIRKRDEESIDEWID